MRPGALCRRSCRTQGVVGQWASQCKHSTRHPSPSAPPSHWTHQSAWLGVGHAEQGPSSGRQLVSACPVWLLSRLREEHRMAGLEVGGGGRAPAWRCKRGRRCRRGAAARGPGRAGCPGRQAAPWATRCAAFRAVRRPLGLRHAPLGDGPASRARCAGRVCHACNHCPLATSVECAIGPHEGRMDETKPGWPTSSRLLKGWDLCAIRYIASPQANAS